MVTTTLENILIILLAVIGVMIFKLMPSIEHSEKRRTIFEKMKDKRINQQLSDYPCEDYLHNALRFLKDASSTSIRSVSMHYILQAYSEICWAIHKSGGQLNDDEINEWKKGDEQWDD